MKVFVLYEYDVCNVNLFIALGMSVCMKYNSVMCAFVCYLRLRGLNAKSGYK